MSKQPAPIRNCEVLGYIEQLPDCRVMVIPTGKNYAVSLGTFPVHADDPTPEEALGAIADFFNGHEQGATS